MKFFEEPQVGRLTSSPVITRCASNPILKAADVPYKSDLVLNAGVTRFKGRYVMVFRNDIRTDEYTVREGVSLGLAHSEDGIEWEVEPKPCFDSSFGAEKGEFINTYDPRLTVIDGRCYMTFGMDTRHGVRGGIAVTDDFEKFEVLSVAAPDNRNFVLFPEKIGGKYVRLERPFPIYGRPGYPERFDIWISDSPDLVYWGNPELLLGVEDVPFSNQKLGAGPPPVKTSKGWLTVFHASDFDATRGRDGFELTWKKRYSAGVMLLDLADPRKVVGMSKKPLLAPEALYETTEGYRNNVVFPTGMILEKNQEVKIYYGAADTCMCLASAQLHDLIALCSSPRTGD
ncbi:MAG TPA: glycoside hydrolase family 130 protein [Bacteroidota bacterium]|jgi:beta-1,4-mannooligosaccharide/beta-1,4-mannosyl-N-acetylglucosamine phosphorylase